ncbi:MAG: hypothetical protein E7308_10910 [Butyrivibrio sp.]|jgi:bla regulator protein BlaR1|nr:hypothetical protein [Butyrivibrio sp.]
MRKKLFAVLMASVMAVSLLAACGKEKAPEPQTQEPAAEQSAPETVEAPVESSTEETIEEARPTSLDDALGLAVLEYNEEFFDQGEVAGEGHILLDKDGSDSNGEQICYTITCYGRYEFEDGNFVCCAGNGAIPCVIRLMINEDGEYNTVSYEPAPDGSNFVDWIKDNFPEKYWSRCITVEDDDRIELERQQRAYAEEYLSTIDREDVEVGDYSDFEHEIFTDVGVSVDVSNAMLDVQSGETFENKCPFWLGEREVIEENVRYTYKTEYDKKKGQIIFSKTEYDTGDEVEKSVYNAKTGDKVE